MPLAYFRKLFILDLWFIFCARQYFFPRRLPSGTHHLAHLRQAFGLLSDPHKKLLDALFGPTVDLEATGQHMRKYILQVRIIQFRHPLCTMGSHHYRAGIRTDAELDTAQPSLYLILLMPLARIPNDNVKRPLTEQRTDG